MKKKVMVAMSGGVDSSVAAAILLEQGYAVSGVTLKLYNDENPAAQTSGRTCCSLEDVEDARSVAARLGIDHYVFNFTQEFHRDVMERFAAGYAAGETPNPCIDCNRYIKFGKLRERADALGIDAIATGHYAIVEQVGDRYRLKKAKDQSKDQTYVLYGMDQVELSRTLFPLGNYTKEEVRAMAVSRGLINARKPDSQDICFVPDGDYGGFLERAMGFPVEPGEIVTVDGQVVGVHQGLFHYTIGQRKGLGIAAGFPLYVVGMEPGANRLIVGPEKTLYCDSLFVEDVNWLAGAPPDQPLVADVKTRYGKETAVATVTPQGEKRALVRFHVPRRATAPGQAAVFYQGDEVIGGGVIRGFWAGEAPGA